MIYIYKNKNEIYKEILLSLTNLIITNNNVDYIVINKIESTINNEFI